MIDKYLNTKINIIGIIISRYSLVGIVGSMIEGGYPNWQKAIKFAETQNPYKPTYLCLVLERTVGSVFKYHAIMIPIPQVTSHFTGTIRALQLVSETIKLLGSARLSRTAIRI